MGKAADDTCLPVEDFLLCEVPRQARRGSWPNAIVLLGFTFFTATMFGGGRIGTRFAFWPDLVLVIALGNLSLGLYVAALSGLLPPITGIVTAFVLYPLLIRLFSAAGRPQTHGVVDGCA